jgi:ribosome-binding factor A
MATEIVKVMQESKRQKQVGALLLQELSDIFQRMGLGMMDGGLISITGVRLTPDLLEARIYLSLFQVKDQPAAMKKIEEMGWEIKRELAARVKNQLRRIPLLQYFLDDTQDHASKMEEIFKQINGQSSGGESSAHQGGTSTPLDGGSAPRDGASGM